MNADAPLARAVLELTRALIARPSVSPRDGGCQDLLMDRLRPLGFHAEPMRFGAVDNFWATRAGRGDAPCLVFAGHTDVVPPGPESAWRSPPFEPTIAGECLYGRGAADMKSSLAAMVCAAERFVGNHPQHRGTLGFLVTSDEEAEAVDGTARVVAALTERGVRIDHCVVGEPSSNVRLGDVVRVGRRGSLSGVATVQGVQGHVAYPEQVDNPIHRAASALHALTTMRWDDGDASFPATSFQVSNIHAGGGAANVVPGRLECRFNFRFNPRATPEALQRTVQRAFADSGAKCEVAWHLSGLPFLTPEGAALIDAARAAIFDVAGVRACLSTSGGTSDGRFIAPTGAEVVEIGPLNDTIHKANERVRLADLAALARIYERIMERLLLP